MSYFLSSQPLNEDGNLQVCMYCMHAQKGASEAPRTHFKACKTSKFSGGVPPDPPYPIYSMGPTSCICPGSFPSSRWPWVWEVVSGGGAPTPAGTSVFTKHNWDMGMGYLWLNGWGIYHLMGGAFMT